MNKRELTCIICPRGCALVVDFDKDGKVSNVSGNLCPRGKVYAFDECTNPVRVITSTVMCSDGVPVSCKTSTAIPKSLVFEAMKIINSLTAPQKVKIGEVLVKNILNTGADVIATSNKN